MSKTKQQRVLNGYPHGGEERIDIAWRDVFRTTRLLYQYAKLTHVQVLGGGLAFKETPGTHPSVSTKCGLGVSQ